MYIPQQGDIVFVNFSPKSGHEQAGRRPGVIVSCNGFQDNVRGFAILCPITNTDNGFPLHIPLDGRTATTGVIETEHVKSMDIVSRNISFKEKLPEDLMKKVVSYVKAFF